MESFNLDNSYKQKLRFLEQKYASLLSGRTDKRKENFLKRINESLSDEDKLETSVRTYELKKDGETVSTVTDVLYNLKEQGLLGVLSKITDPDKLRSVVSMLAKSGKFISDLEADPEKANSTDIDSLRSSLDEYNTILINSFLIDLEEYKKVKKSIDEIEGETTQGHKNSQLFSFISDNVSKSLNDVLNKGEWFLDEEKPDVDINLPSVHAKYDEDGNLIGEEISTGNDENSGEELKNAIRKNFVNPIAFFHTVQRIYQKYNYVITAKEIGNLKTIFSDIKKGRMVFLTGDTGSGKTELCLLISHLYLDEIYGKSDEGKNKEPVIVTGNSEIDFSDFTMEKIVTSENYLSSSDDALNKEETMENKVKNFVDNINKTVAFRESVKSVINQNDKLSETEKQQQCERVDKEDLLEYNIFTKYHLQGMIKAMREGVPLIIDEMNGIRPEVLLGLNHYFTRKVGQKVSLGNGFSPITIKKGFCIMCTGNDKDENSNAKRYKGRYTIDESLMNRMRRICKGYHKQEIKKFENENASDLRENSDMLDYMTGNELYGVILMLLFSKKENKKINKLGNEEFKKETATKLLTHTEVTGFDIMKEKFVDMNSNEEKKKAFFGELTKLASFIKLIQKAFQGNITMCGNKDVKTMMENSQGFSMRDLLTIINSYKADTKSLWYHIYNEYIRMIPESNQAREGIYLIAREVGFLSSYTNIDGDASVREITKDIEKNLQREKQTSGKNDNFELMDIHNKKLEISEALLSNGRLIITKQDLYKEYFGDKFSDGIEIKDSEIEQYEEELKRQSNNSPEDTEIYESDENCEYTQEGIISICESILGMSEDYPGFFKSLDFQKEYILNSFCEEYQNEEKVRELNNDDINKIGKALSTIENIIISSKDKDIDEGELEESISLLSGILTK